jgi:hypothetical protein
VIVIDYKLTRIPAYNALFYGGLKVKKIRITNYVSELATVYSVSVSAAAHTTPAIKAIQLLPMRRKVFSSRRLCFFTASTS